MASGFFPVGRIAIVPPASTVMLFAMIVRSPVGELNVAPARTTMSPAITTRPSLLVSAVTSRPMTVKAAAPASSDSRLTGRRPSRQISITPLASKKQPIRNGPAATASSNPGKLSDAHRLQYLNLLGALAGTEKLRVDLETNRQSVGVITAAYESART